MDPSLVLFGGIWVLEIKIVNQTDADSTEGGTSFAQLVRDARAGDPSATGQLLEKYRNYLLLIANEEFDQYLQAKLGPSDVVQQSILQAQQNFEQFRGESEPELQAWLKRIMLNDLQKTRRKYATHKRNAGQEVNLEDHSALRRGLFVEQLTPGSEALQREKARALDEALASLSDDHRQVICMRNLEQKSFFEIGEAMDRSPEAARKLWARAIESLQDELLNLAPELMTGILPPIESDD
ncbi:MAG: sigma-70 family RNA polymerase sigma factor [Pirellulaceae bacterium]